MDQVIWTLLGNAQKQGPPEGPISVTATATEGGVEVLVRDRRPPVAARTLEHLFDAGFEPGGTSLGLSICRRLVEAQRGAIWARPSEEGGMEFGLRLPALVGELLS
jgi:signal transduction histidine kinase